MSKLCVALERTGSPCKDIAFRLSSARTPICWLQTWRTYGKKIANPDRILTFGRLMEFSVSWSGPLGRWASIRSKVLHGGAHLEPE